jgi:hypothetical protein
MGSVHGYRYVGPAVLAEHARPGPGVTAVTSEQVLTRWLSGRPANELGEPLTFVVGLDGQLRLAPRRSEHVDCAAGQPVLAAGEMLFAREGARWSVSEISNQSTGYCPDADSWPAVAAALDRAGVAHPATSRTRLCSAAAGPAVSSTSSGTATSPARYATAHCRRTGISALPESRWPLPLPCTPAAFSVSSRASRHECRSTHAGKGTTRI